MQPYAKRSGTWKPSAERRLLAVDLHALLEAFQRPIVVLSPDGTVLATNRAAAERMGNYKDEAPGLPVWETPWVKSLPALHPALHEAIGQAAAGRQACWTLPLPTPDLDSASLRLLLTPVLDDLGKATAIILERDANENRPIGVPYLGTLDESEFLLVASRLGPWSWDLERDRMQIPAVTESILGLPDGRHITKLRDFETLIHPEDLPAVQAALRNAIAGLEDYDVQFRLCAPGKGPRWFSCRGGVRKNAEGKAVWMAGAVIDIHERKEAVLAMERSERSYRDLVDTLDGIVWKADLGTFRFTFVSQRAERILGYPAAQWTGEPDFWVKHLHPEDAEWCIAFCRKAAAEGRDHEFEYRMIGADGRVVWLHDAVTCYPEPDGTVCLRGIMIDVSSRKEAEQRVRTANGRLGEELRRRNQVEEELQTLSESLIDTQEHERIRIARALHDDLGQRIAGLGYAMFNVKGKLSVADAALLEPLQASISRLGADVRALSHELQPVTIEHAGLEAAIRALCAEVKSARGLAVVCKIQGPVSDVSAQTAWGVYRVAQELLENAAKHSGASQAYLSLIRRSNEICLSIRDHGAGFDPRAGAGKGVGLLNMRARVRLLSGRLRVRSKLGEGTAIHVNLPATA